MPFNSRQLTLLIGVLVIGAILTWNVLPMTKEFSAISGQEVSSIDASTNTPPAPVNDASATMPRKPGEPEGYAPTPFPDAPLPPGDTTVEPGQPETGKTRPSPEEIAKLAIPSPVSPDVPYQNHVVYDVSPVNSKSAAFQSRTIVIAKVHQIHPAQWSTVDGKRPQNPHDNNNPSFIFTRISVKIEQVLRGETVPDEILTLLQNGGKIGEDVLTTEGPYPEFAEGQTLLLYLDSLDTSQLPTPIWEMPAKIWIVRERYLVDPSTQLATNPFAQRSVDELIAEIEEIKQLKPEDLKQTP